MSEVDRTEGQAEYRAQGHSRWRELYETEDYWAIWLGLAIIVVGTLVFLPKPPPDMGETIRQSNAIMAEEAALRPGLVVQYHVLTGRQLVDAVDTQPQRHPFNLDTKRSLGPPDREGLPAPVEFQDRDQQAGEPLLFEPQQGRKHGIRIPVRAAEGPVGCVFGQGQALVSIQRLDVSL